jgi:glycosyltransferase involved in cell wall biosynthesis
MKIAHLIYSLKTGGAQTMLVDIANEQAASSEVYIVLINDSYSPEILAGIDKKIKIIYIKRKPGSRNPLPVLKLNLFLFRMSFDAIHCHNHDIIPLLFPSLKKKTVLTVHSIGIDHRYFNQYRQVFAISKIVKEDIARRSGLVPVLVYNGISTQRFLKKDGLEHSGVFKIVIVSRLDHEVKGQHLVLEALSILKDKTGVKLDVDLIGSGVSEAYLVELVSKYNLKDNVNILGLKDRNYICAHLKDYDLLVQPSLFEGFGLTVAEAMAAKVPVLVSDIDGPMEIIGEGEYGFCFRSGDPESLAAQISAILTDYNTDKFRMKVESAYKHVKLNFEVAETAKHYIDYYRN